MKMENDIQRISTLIIRSIHSPLSVDEQRELEEWRERSPRNEEMYLKLTEQQFSRKEYSRFRWARDTDDWAMLQKKIRARRENYFSLSWLSRYAGIIVVGIVAIYFMQQDPMDSKIREILTQQIILPGETQAILELEGGERIVLGQSGGTEHERLSALGISEGETSIVYVVGDSVKAENHVLRVPRGGEYILALSDGTKVWVNSESVLRYPSHFEGDERRVSIEGEAYFQVAENVSKPFIVETDGMDVRVTGTEFNVMAYRDKDRIETTLVQGSVVVEAGGKVEKITPNTQAVFSKNDGRLITRMVNPELYTSWKDGVFEFNDLSLREIAGQLGRWYDVEFRFPDESVAEIRFTGAAQKTRSITFILDIIKDTKAVNYQIDGKMITIMKK